METTKREPKIFDITLNPDAEHRVKYSYITSNSTVLSLSI